MTGTVNIPIPDPSVLTTEALRRDISAVRETMEAKIFGREAVVDERFRGLDDKIALVVQMGSKELEAKLGALEARLDRGDGKIIGQAYKESSGDRLGSFVFAVIGALLGVSSLIFSIIVFATRH